MRRARSERQPAVHEEGVVVADVGAVEPGVAHMAVWEDEQAKLGMAWAERLKKLAAMNSEASTAQ